MEWFFLCLQEVQKSFRIAIKDTRGVPKRLQIPIKGDFSVKKVIEAYHTFTNCKLCFILCFFILCIYMSTTKHKKSIDKQLTKCKKKRMLILSLFLKPSQNDKKSISFRAKVLRFTRRPKRKGKSRSPKCSGNLH